MVNAFEPKVLTVSQVNEYVKMLLDSEPLLADLYVKGEISNFTSHRSGHLYFTLKDETAAVKAVMFRSAAAKLKFVPQNGMKVLAKGRVSVFVRDGQYQLYCESLEPDGLGALYLAFEQLKNKLAAEGLFDESRKKPLPKIPLRVGIITSPTGAALRYDKHNAWRFRLPSLCCSRRSCRAQKRRLNDRRIKYFGSTRSGVIIIGRGGGSIEDLWAFNDEGLRARSPNVLCRSYPPSGMKSTYNRRFCGRQTHAHTVCSRGTCGPRHGRAETQDKQHNRAHGAAYFQTA